MKRLLVEDGVGRDARYWRLAQAHSALYPAGADEKRRVDGVLARMIRGPTQARSASEGAATGYPR